MVVGESTFAGVSIFTKAATGKSEGKQDGFIKPSSEKGTGLLLCAGFLSADRDFS